MPELPEVEVIYRGLEPLVVGKAIVSAGCSGHRLRSFQGDLAGWNLEGQKVQAIGRRSKYLVLVLSQTMLGLHLGMSGQLIWRPRKAGMASHTHAWLCFSGYRLDYVDPRRFGDLKRLARPADVSTEDLIDGLMQGRWDNWLSPGPLGAEPLSEGFSPDLLYKASRGVQQSIKPWLMRGHVVVGVGNIYASEALHAAGIHPSRAAGRVARGRYERLALEIQSQLSAAIRAGGSTLRDFRSAHGEPGDYALAHKVYDQEGKPCKRCGRPVRRLIQAQRSSFFCSGCQR
ncbi:MAG: bifunctional DNA-formamidopyrimidine glycosylase/DNA-(apurinic or apyrimidinic site) lyase [Burkholderiaceae bacterium]|jgi:formamidopyrimidine-DNA glycosylase